MTSYSDPCPWCMDGVKCPAHPIPRHPPKMNLQLRDFAIREIGCLVGHILGLGVIECEKHHLLTTGLHGNGKRRGERETIGLNPWSHRGVPFGGLSAAQCEAAFGPSYARNARAFRSRFGSDDELLALQDNLINAWQKGNVA